MFLFQICRYTLLLGVIYDCFSVCFLIPDFDLYSYSLYSILYALAGPKIGHIKSCTDLRLVQVTRESTKEKLTLFLYPD